MQDIVFGCVILFTVIVYHVNYHWGINMSAVLYSILSNNGSNTVLHFKLSVSHYK